MPFSGLLPAPRSEASQLVPMPIFPNEMALIPPHPNYPLLEFVGLPFHRLYHHIEKEMVEHVEQLCHSGSRIRRRSGLPTEVQDGRNDHLEFGLVTES